MRPNILDLKEICENKAHIQNNVPSDEKYLTCNSCEKTFTSSGKVKNHIFIVHGQKDQNNYKCKSCGKSFTQEVTLNEHIYDSTNKVGHLYCRNCVGIKVSNLRRILCNKFISKVSESWIESEFRHTFDTNPTVDDQPYSPF